MAWPTDTNAKDGLIFVLILIGAVVLAVSLCIWAHHYEGSSEASDRQYEDAENFFMENPKLKDMLQDAMLDGILTKHEYNLIDEEHDEIIEAEKTAKKEAAQQARRSKLLKAVYEKVDDENNTP